MEKKLTLSKFCLAEIKIFMMSIVAVFDFRFICVLLFCLGDCIAFGISSISGTIMIIYIHIYMYFPWKNCKIASNGFFFSCIRVFFMFNGLWKDFNSNILLTALWFCSLKNIIQVSVFLRAYLIQKGNKEFEQISFLNGYCDFVHHKFYSSVCNNLNSLTACILIFSPCSG